MSESWIPFIILSTLIYTGVNFLDKYILERQIRDYRGMVVYSSIVALFAGTILWFITGLPVLSATDMALVLLTGAFNIWGAALYFQVMRDEDASKVVFLMQMLPVMVLVLSYVLLSEPLTNQQLVGFGVIFFATTMASRTTGTKNSSRSTKALWLMLLANTLWALTEIAFKFVSEENTFSNMIPFEIWGWGLGGIVLLLVPEIRVAFLNNARFIRKKVLGIVFLNELMFIGSKFFAFMAISLGPVALVNVLSGTHVFFAIGASWILGILMPSVFKEKVNKFDAVMKVVYALLTFLGLVIVATA